MFTNNIDVVVNDVSVVNMFNKFEIRLRIFKMFGNIARHFHCDGSFDLHCMTDGIVSARRGI